ncbi:ATP-binding protein [Nonomuraea jiangxiensis]|uniref:histidine kinase n=1 Tax=Nonomuraea jiangxiensis TaxID=633440 RepID=A0A1G8C5L7_9ACTN|nr:ATP-binding protein [Nonomuraea jiangxiensis]SDH40826.1 Signal transduction histidine kinase [Nonomuraea jiangxiensis]
MDVVGQEGLTALEWARKRFCAGEPVESGVRPWVLTSWERSRHMGVVPYQVPTVLDLDIDVDGRLIQAAAPVLDQLESQLSGIKVAVVLGDAHARVLQRRVGEPSLLRWLDHNLVVPGFGFPEQAIGTNGIGTALAERRPVLIWGREHYADIWGELVCAASPVRDPVSGRVEGVLNLACLDRFADAAMLGIAVDATARIEECLLEQTSQREQVLLRAFLAARREAGGGAAVACRPITEAVPIAPHDRHSLLEKAAELISADRTGVAVVLLSGGRSATLVSRAIENAAGTRGIAVEAILTDGSFWHVASGPREVQRDGPPEAQRDGSREAQRHEPGEARGDRPRAAPGDGAGVRWEPPPAVALAPLPPDDSLPDTPVTADDRWLLAVGEPGVGRLALQARERLSLLWEAGARVGTSLDVTRTAQELTEVAVPRFADFVAVDLPDPVPRGDAPGALDTGLRRIALATTLRNFDLAGVGALVHPHPATPQGHCLAGGQSVLKSELDGTLWLMAQDPAGTRKAHEQGIHSVIVVPMRARDVTLGVVSFYRSRRMSVFEEDDLALAEELVGRAAVCVDNARRYTHEHMMSAELERAAESLKQSLDRQRRFTTDASHELRTPLAGLRAQLEEAQLHPGETDLTALLDHALGDVDRLQAIITDLLLLARLEAVPATAFERVELARIVEGEVSRRFGDRCPVRLDLDPGVIVNAVPTQIRRVLGNLLDNARRHAAHAVVVRVSRAGDRAELSVTDDGPGIPEAEREHVFQRFARLDTARSRGYGGAGLGLAIARDIAHNHQGTLHVEEARPHGARFVFRLPLAEPPAAELAHTGPARPRRSHRTRRSPRT